MKKKIKTLSLCLGIMVLLFVASVGIWRLNKREIVKEGNVLGIDWYDENGTEFTITTIKQFREFSELSEYYDFEDQVIKLGSDLVDNEGVSTEWEEIVPEHIWNPIKNFAGTFDGQGHTISGICGYGFVYQATDKEIVREATGLFTNTQESCVIKNFSLVNSFFYSDFNEGVGSISSHGGGTFDSIYSNATILTYKQNSGGLIGMLDATGSHTVTNCWFDGLLMVQGNFGRYAGGIVGRVCDTNGQNKIEHCLNTGILSSALDGKGVNLGGIVGNVAPSARVAIKDCLNTGSLRNDYGIAVGSIVGVVEGQLNLSDTYTTLESFKKSIGAVLGVSTAYPVEYTEDMLRGYSGYQWTTLDFEEYWAVQEDGMPVLKKFADDVPDVKKVEKQFDISWYDAKKSEFTITDRKELYGFAILSRSVDFSEKTISLGADIVINEGNAKDWMTEAPEYQWLSVGSESVPFAGTFDGEMHSVSGVYLTAGTNYSGFFSTTSDEAVIKNFKLENSYLCSTAQSFGGVAGRGRGTFDTIYCNAIVVGTTTNLGGLVGQVPGKSIFSMTNCWFDGQVIHKGNSISDRKTGGLVGVLISNGTMDNCLNTGTIDASQYKTPNEKNQAIVAPLAGGLVGHVMKDVKLTLKNSLNAGNVKVSDAATAAYGSVVGYIDGSIVLSNTYSLSDSCTLHAVRNSEAGEVAVFGTELLEGYHAYQWTFLDFDRYWAVVKGNTPVLRSFANEIPSLSGIEKMYDISWYRDGRNNYVIDSRKDLYGFTLLCYNTDYEGKTVKLGADITVNTGDASSWGKLAPAYEWMPIGSEKYPFAGTFDGNMHSISGIYLNTDDRYAGLFALSTESTVIKNFSLVNSYIETTAGDCGSIVGRGGGIIDTVKSSAIVVSSNARVGGLVGQLLGEGTVINNCWFAGEVIATGNHLDYRRTGGLVGLSNGKNVRITNCLNSGVVNTSAYTTHNSATSTLIVPLSGGIVGHVFKETSLTISGCMNTGEILCSDEALKGSHGYGSIVGYSDGATKISDTYATTESCKQISGGLAKNISGTGLKVTTASITGYKGYQWTVLDFADYWAWVMESTPILKSFADHIPTIAGIDKMIDFGWYDDCQDTYVLMDAADLYGFAKLSLEHDFSGKTVKLGADIVINTDMTNPGYAWTPIGSQAKPFAGTFDGNMQSIRGLYLDTTDRFAGLFAVTADSAVIRNLCLEDSYIRTTAGDCGSIVGRGGGTIDTVKSSATVISSNARVGGLVGQLLGEGAVINNCWFAGKVIATGNHLDYRRTGGLIGLVNGTGTRITNCLNSGEVDITAYTIQTSATNKNVVPLGGGLVGQVFAGADTVILGCLNTGHILCSSETLSGTSGYGSLVGYSDGKTTITGTYVTAESCKQISGGLAANISGKAFRVDESSIKGYKGYQWTILDFENYWAVVDNPTEAHPILKSFAGQIPTLSEIQKMIDFSWKESAKGTADDPYVLMDAADLYGLATLSADDDFDGKVIQLGADIVVNTGNANEWSVKTPDYQWTPIGSQTKPFAGTFDGNMHSISGLYLNTDSRWVGLFSSIKSTAKVCNLKLNNSYFRTTAADVGSITGILSGTLDTVYSEALIDCMGTRSGGLAGQVSGTEARISNCWFAGELKTNTGKGQAVGGLAGIVLNGAKLTVQSCLVSGVIDVTQGHDSPQAGGFIGCNGQGKSGSTEINDSLFDGMLKVNDKQKANKKYGVRGYLRIGSSITGVNNYYTSESTDRIAAAEANSGFTNTVSTTKVSQSAIIGESAKNTMKNLSWGQAWSIVDGALPVLSAFEER